MQTSIAATVNPFAGMHPVTASPAEVEAVRRATEAALHETPYYLERYGERGRLFGGSDGGWLVTLCAGDAEFVERQVLWLGRVLASRGMPRWLLQRYLQLLHAELAAAGPEHAGKCALLMHGATLLERVQRLHLPEPDARTLVDTFGLRTDAGWLARLPGMGRILAGAVADEAAGISRAVEAVVEWAADPARFPGRWVSAVQTTVAEGRGRVRVRVAG